MPEGAKPPYLSKFLFELGEVQVENRDQYKRLIMFAASAVILLIQVLIFWLIWRGYYNYSSVIGKLYFRRGNWALLMVYAVINFFFSKLFNAYKVGYLKVSEVILSQILAVICCNFMTYIQLSLIGRWSFLSYFGPVIFMTVLDIAAVTGWVIFMRWIYAKIFPPRHMLLIYGTINPRQLVNKIKTRSDKYVIVDNVCLSEGFNAVTSRIDQYECVIIGDIPSAQRNKLLKYCFRKRIRAYTIPKISDIMIKSSTTLTLFDTELYLFRNRKLTIEQSLFKRVMDIVVSLLILIILSPALLLVCIAIKAHDGGPIIYKQDRLTLDGKIFKIYKFRSMKVDSEKSGAQLAGKADDRITPVGKVIRRLHVDELPQLFNILKGDMSFVGPRPERPEIAEQYQESIPEFDFRLKMKAGLTGYAQVFGNYRTTPLDKLKLDLTYIENYSILLDIMIIIQTVKIFFQKENSEGLDNGEKTALQHKDKV